MRVQVQNQVCLQMVPPRLTKVPPPPDIGHLYKQAQIEISTIHRSRERLGRVEETIARQE